jgi:hypothetical protein
LMKGRIYAGTGFTYLKKGMYEEAQKEFEKAESFSPGSVDFVRMMIS